MMRPKSFARRRASPSAKTRGTSETFRLAGGIKIVLSAPRKVGSEEMVQALLKAVEQLRRQAAA